MTIGQAYADLDQKGTLNSAAQSMGIGDLCDQYNLSRDDGMVLYKALMPLVNKEYVIDPVDAMDLKDIIIEAQHQSYDGWSDDHAVVIRAFVADLAFGLSQYGTGA